ncbi:hypothetical protein OFN54_39570, partial [Escherichia coli]|nr:hypothetical protein [Escherichia coli]
MTVSVPSKATPRLRHAVSGQIDNLTRIGTQARFYFGTITGIRDAVLHYRIEMVRLIAQMSMGSGAL